MRIKIISLVFLMGFILSAFKGRETLKQKLAASTVIYFIPANEVPSDVYFHVSKIRLDDEKFVPKDKAVLEESIDFKVPFLLGSDIEKFNQQVFNYLKEKLGAQVKWIPDSYRIEKIYKGKKYYDYNLKTIPFEYCIMANYATRAYSDASYNLHKVSSIYDEGKLISIGLHNDLTLSLYEKVKEGRQGRILISSSKKLIGYHSMIYGPGSEVLGTLNDEAHHTDFFRWSTDYLEDQERLKKAVKDYIEKIQTYTPERIESVLTDFDAVLRKELEF